MEVDLVEAALQCRVYGGTPEKVGKKRLLEISAEEQKPVFKAILIDDADGVSLRDGEVLITHKTLKNENEKLMVLATTGCSEVVLVVEGLLLLQEDFDMEFHSLCGMRKYFAHVAYLFKDMEAEEKPTFSRFCFALRKALATNKDSTPTTPKSEGKSLRVSAQPGDAKMIEAMKRGIDLYNAVGEAVMEQHEHKDSAVSREICEFSPRNLRAWVELYRRRRDRHILSYPFRFISNDLSTARRAFSVLQYIVEHDECETLAPLLKAAIPRISMAIKKREKDIEEEEAELDVGDELVEECVGRLRHFS